jgi:hypothetical protein
MAPSLDRQEARQFLRAAPVHSHAEALRHHHAAVVAMAQHVDHAPAGISVAAAPPVATMTGFSVDPSPFAPNGTLVATAAIAEDDIYAVGYDDVQTAPPAFNSPLAEHFNAMGRAGASPAAQSPALTTHSPQ